MKIGRGGAYEWKWRGFVGDLAGVEQAMSVYHMLWKHLESWIFWLFMGVSCFVAILKTVYLIMYKCCCRVNNV